MQESMLKIDFRTQNLVKAKISMRKTLRKFISLEMFSFGQWKMLGLHYHELIKQINKHEGKKKCLMVDNDMLDKILDKIKEIIGI